MKGPPRFLRDWLSPPPPPDSWELETRYGPQNAFVAEACWNVETVSARFMDKPFYSATIDYPFAGARHHDRLLFRYLVAAPDSPGAVYRMSGGDAITDLGKRSRILYDICDHLACSQSLRLNAARACENAKAELERFVADFEEAVRADIRRVTSELSAGRAAHLSTWDSMTKPPQAMLDAVRSTVKSIVPTAEDLIEDARVRIKKAIEVAREDYRLAYAEFNTERVRAYLIEKGYFEQVQMTQDERKQRLGGIVHLADHAGRNGIIFGTPVEDGADMVIPVNKIQHTLVGGVPGSGKTVFLHSLIVQFLRSPEVERVILIDLKGTEFPLYDDQPKARVYTDINTVAAALDEVIDVLATRKASLAKEKRRTWSGPRVFVVIDEYAMINAHIGEAKMSGQKAEAARLANNLRQIVLTARSVGVVMICALQKPTSDAIDSNLKANMGFRCCFRVKTRQAVEAVLDATGEELPIDPRDLRVGRFVFDSGSTFTRMQAHVPPELDLSGGW